MWQNEETKFIFYKTKTELLNLYHNSKNENCSICLSSLLNEKDTDKKIMIMPKKI